MVMASLLVLAAGVAAVAADDLPRASAWGLLKNALLQKSVAVAMSRFSEKMVDPAIDDGGTFSYFVRPSFQLGLRGEQNATQVIDGRFWTGAAEWTLLLGPDLQPHTQRIWTLLEGYLPCIRYAVKQGDIEYTLEAFQFALSGEAKNPTNFIRVTAKNLGAAPAPAPGNEKGKG